MLLHFVVFAPSGALYVTNHAPLQVKWRALFFSFHSAQLDSVTTVAENHYNTIKCNSSQVVPIFDFYWAQLDSVTTVAENHYNTIKCNSGKLTQYSQLT